VPGGAPGWAVAAGVMMSHYRDVGEKRARWE
jgi:hypothetical protein